MNEEIQCTTNKGKRKNVYEWMEKDDSVLLQVLYSVHKKLESYFPYFLTSLNKDSLVLLKVITV